jgi:iron(III) transport system ATP-binding protein
MTAIRIDRVTKSYGTTKVVQDVSLQIDDGELFFLLGPSGCGKTTLLRAIAGFVAPDGGDIAFDGQRVNDLPPRERNTGMVFQNYALWPHMTVAQNIAFGLDVRGVSPDDRARQVAEAVALVQLKGLEHHRPTQLSGGQQQRVALARALVVRPKVLLLDEPLSNLDARLRAEMREEIRRVHSETRLTTVYVTHDQKEALSLADRMALMHAGKVVQLGTPQEIYGRPCNRFVASFLGDANFIDGTVVEARNGTVAVDTSVGKLVGTVGAQALRAGSRVVCCMRPESISIEEPGSTQPNRFRSTVVREVFLGELRHVYLNAGAWNFTCYRLQGDQATGTSGSPVDCVVAPNNVVVLPPE